MDFVFYLVDGVKLRLARRKARLSRKDLSKLSGVSHTSIRLAENLAYQLPAVVGLYLAQILRDTSFLIAIDLRGWNLDERTRDAIREGGWTNE